MSVNPAATAAKALRDFLLWKLPSSTVTVNATRAATLRSPGPGPFVIPAAAVLKTSVVNKAGLTSSHPLTTGTRTTTQVAADINAIVPSLASVDSTDHLLLTSTNAPSYVAATLAATYSVMAVGTDETGANAALGFDITGEHAITTPLTPPGLQGVCDGMPTGGFFNSSQLGKGRMLVTIGERTFRMKDDNSRRFEWLVELDVAIFRSEPQQVVHQSREGIQAALQAFTEPLLTDVGKVLSAGSSGIVGGRIDSGRIAPWSFRSAGADGKPLPGGILFDAINLKYLCLVYQVPAS